MEDQLQLMHEGKDLMKSDLDTLHDMFTDKKRFSTNDQNLLACAWMLLSMDKMSQDAVIVEETDKERARETAD